MTTSENLIKDVIDSIDRLVAHHRATIESSLKMERVIHEIVKEDEDCPGAS